MERHGVLKSEMGFAKGKLIISHRHWLGRLGQPIGGLYWAFSQLLSSPWLTFQLVAFPTVDSYIIESALVTSVGNGSPSNCSQKHCWFLCIVFPPHYMVRGHSIPRQITTEGYFRGRVIGSQIRKPHFQSQLYSEPKRHRTMYITPVYRVGAKKAPKW